MCRWNICTFFRVCPYLACSFKSVSAQGLSHLPFIFSQSQAPPAKPITVLSVSLATWAPFSSTLCLRASLPVTLLPKPHTFSSPCQSMNSLPWCMAQIVQIQTPHAVILFSSLHRLSCSYPSMGLLFSLSLPFHRFIEWLGLEGTLEIIFCLVVCYTLFPSLVCTSPCTPTPTSLSILASHYYIFHWINPSLPHSQPPLKASVSFLSLNV